MAGDRIVKVDGKNFMAHKLQTIQFKTLRGQGGTKVKLSIHRSGTGKLIDYTITGATSPFTALMPLTWPIAKRPYTHESFWRKTYDEYMEAYEKLKWPGACKNSF
jgi:hypothetical protein